MGIWNRAGEVLEHDRLPKIGRVMPIWNITLKEDVRREINDETTFIEIENIDSVTLNNRPVTLELFLKGFATSDLFVLNQAFVFAPQNLYRTFDLEIQIYPVLSTNWFSWEDDE